MNMQDHDHQVGHAGCLAWYIPSLTPAGGSFSNLVDKSEAAILRVPFTLPGAMVQLSVLALPAATTIVICGQDFIASGGSPTLESTLAALLLTLPACGTMNNERYI